MIRSRHVAGDGVRLTLFESATDAERAILFLHGVGRRFGSFAPLLPHVLPRWRIAGLDHRGHGASDRAADGYRVVDYAADTVAVVAGQFAAPVILHGHSLGALVALATAAAVPAHVAAVVLEDPPGPSFVSQIAHTGYHALFELFQRHAGSRLAVADLARELAEARLPPPGGGAPRRLGDVRDAASLRFTARCLADADPAVFAPLFDGSWLAGLPWEPTLAAVRCPVLLLRADMALGGMLPADDADLLERQLGDLTRIECRGVGHTIHGQAPELLARFLLPFLEALGDEGR